MQYRQFPGGSQGASWRPLLDGVMETQELAVTPKHGQGSPTIEPLDTHPHRAPPPPPRPPGLQSSAPPAPLAEQTLAPLVDGRHGSTDPARGTTGRPAGQAAGRGSTEGAVRRGAEGVVDDHDRGKALMPSPVNDGTLAVVGVHGDADAGSGRAAAAARPPPPGILDLSIRRRGAVIELVLAGDLDMATAPRLGEAMAWLRCSCGAAPTILIDTSDLDFIAAAGYRALQAALVRPDGLWDPRVLLVVGPAVARLEAAISASSTPSARRSEAARRGASSETHGPSGHRGRRLATAPPR